MKMSFALSSGLSLAMLAATLAPAQALSARVLVSSAGADQPGCGASAAGACRTFQYIINNIIAPGGEIDVLNAGGYGPIVITQSIKIINDGAGTAGIGFVAGGASIAINAGPTDNIVLTGLNVDGFGSGANGVALTSAGSLTIDKCAFRNFHATTGFTTGNGVLLTQTSGSVKLSITNSSAANNEGAGVSWVPASGNANLTASLDHITAINNQIGILIDGVNNLGATAASLSNSVVNNNVAGVNLFGNTSFTAVIDSTEISNNSGIGLQDQNNAITLLRRSIVASNGTGVNNTGTINTYGDNSINGNAVDLTGNVLIAVALK